MSTIGIVSYRLGGADGVSIEAAKWKAAISSLGFSVREIAGEGPEQVTAIESLRIDSTNPVDVDQLEEALDGLDRVIVENLCSLPLTPSASEAVAHALRGRPAILRHHDLSWQRPDTAHFGPPPTDPLWQHVTINQRSRDELATRDILATCLYNRFEMNPPPGDRHLARTDAGIDTDALVVLQPTRALQRKNIAGGLALAESLGATYWLTAAAEDGYGPTLDELLHGARVQVVRGQGPGTINDVYAASDIVVLPSLWEGFGNPVIESVTHRKPLALGNYPVAQELLEFGFQFFSPLQPQPLQDFLADPDEDLLEENFEIAQTHFDIADLPSVLDDLFASSSLGI